MPYRWRTLLLNINFNTMLRSFNFNFIISGHSPSSASQYKISWSLLLYNRVSHWRRKNVQKNLLTKLGFRGLSGLGMGFVFMVARTITTEWFDTKYHDVDISDSIYSSLYPDSAWPLGLPRQEWGLVSLSFPPWQRLWWRNGAWWGHS